MNRRQKLYLSSVCMIITTSVSYSQTRQDSTLEKKALPDSIRQKAVAYVAGKFAIARPLNIEFTTVLPYRYTLDPQGNASLPNGKLTSFNQLKASTNYNFIRKRKWMLGATLDLRYYNIGADIADPSATTKSVKKDFLFHTSAVNFTYFSKLFGKTVIYGTSIMADGSEKSFERVRGLAYGTMIIKATGRTKITAGVIGNIGPNNQIPVLPIFTYEHKFGKDLVIDVLLPKQILLRKYFPKRARLSVGAEMDQTDFFIYNINALNSSMKYEFQQANANMGMMYEHLLGENFVLTFRSGARVPFGGRFYEKNDVRNPIFKLSSGTGLYFNAGISFNPFISKNRK